MKKTYIAPTMKVVPLRMQSHILTASIKSNTELEFLGPTFEDFDEDDMR